MGHDSSHCSSCWHKMMLANVGPNGEPIAGFLQVMENLENLEKRSYFGKVMGKVMEKVMENIFFTSTKMLSSFCQAYYVFTVFPLLLLKMQLLDII